MCQSQRQRAATAGAILDRVRAIAGDPHMYRVADLVTEANDAGEEPVGRPRQFPDWCLIVFGACIRVFGSASSTERNLADPLVWGLVLDGARSALDPAVAEQLPASAPSRDHWVTFVGSRLGDGVLDEVLTLQRDLGVERAHEVGLLIKPERQQVGAYKRQNVVGIDGKVFSSPVRTLDTERVDRRTGEVRPVRDDPARERYGEGGQDGIVWGTKFAIASVRAPAANTRVILAIQHFSSKTRGGEGRVFTELACDLAERSEGIQAFTVDGAWRGTHLNQVQSATGCGVISPARHRKARSGGITVGRYSYAAQPLPWSPRRAKREDACGGHQLWAAAGTLFEQVIDLDGNSTFVELHRHQTKRDVTTLKDGSRTYQFYARYSLPCLRTGTTHDWWEPLLPVAADAASNFNRCEYLRVVPAVHEQHQRVYGMRQDTESLNAQLERAFYGMRLPAWGVHRQTAVVLCAALAENAWARAVC